VIISWPCGNFPRPSFHKKSFNHWNWSVYKHGSLGVRNQKKLWGFEEWIHGEGENIAWWALLPKAMSSSWER
jgi:hypothetical protein